MVCWVAKMAEVHRTLEQMNEAQRKTIVELTARVKELGVWERFASHLINNCIGQVITEEALEQWLSQVQK